MITTYLIGMSLTAITTLWALYGVPDSEFDTRRFETWMLFLTVVLAWPIWVIVLLIDYFSDEGENP